MKGKRSALLAYLITILAGLALAVLIAFYQGLAPGLPADLSLRYASDGLFASGFMFTGIGALVWVAGATDFFDIFSYGVKSLLLLFTALKSPREHPSFYEYKESRREKRERPRVFLLVVGLALLAASAICLFLYYRV